MRPIANVRRTRTLYIGVSWPRGPAYGIPVFTGRRRPVIIRWSETVGEGRSLLKLKRVEIQGFKSFYDRTEMKFNGSGIAAVVGPNGCGKSNLSDAISWVLGEQSAKSLRGARMEDVIFSGTRDRKALGMASVNMTLVPDEVAIAAANIARPAKVLEGAEPAESGGQPGEALPASDEADGHRNGTEPAPAPPKTNVAKSAERSGEITITRRLYRSGESE